MSQSNTYLSSLHDLKIKTNNYSNITVNLYQKHYLQNGLSLAEIQEYLLHDKLLSKPSREHLQKIFFMIPKKQLIKQKIQDELITNFFKVITDQSSKTKISRANTFTSQNDLNRRNADRKGITNKQDNIIQILAYKPNNIFNTENEIQKIVGIIAYSLLHYCLCSKNAVKLEKKYQVSMVNLRTVKIFHLLKQMIYELPFHQNLSEDFSYRNLEQLLNVFQLKSNQQRNNKSPILDLPNKVAIFAKFLTSCQQQSKSQISIYDEIDFSMGIDEIICQIFKILFTDPLLKIVTAETVENIFNSVGFDKAYIKKIDKEKILIKFDHYQTRIWMNKNGEYYFAILQQNQLFQRFQTQINTAEDLVAVNKGFAEVRKFQNFNIQLKSENVMQILQCVQQQVTSPILNRKLGKRGFQALKKETIRSEGQISQQSDNISECVKIVFKNNLANNVGINMIDNLNLEISLANSKLDSQELLNQLVNKNKHQGVTSALNSQELREIERYLLSSKFSNTSIQEIQNKLTPKMLKKSSYGIDSQIKNDLDKIQHEHTKKQNLQNLQIRLVESLSEDNSKPNSQRIISFEDQHFTTTEKQNLTLFQQIKKNNKIQEIQCKTSFKQPAQCRDNIIIQENDSQLQLSFIQKLSESEFQKNLEDIQASININKINLPINQICKNLPNINKMITTQTNKANRQKNKLIKNVPKLDNECFSSDSQQLSPERKAILQFKALVSPKHHPRKQQDEINYFALTTQIKRQQIVPVQKIQKQQLASPLQNNKSKKLPYQFNRDRYNRKSGHHKNLTQQTVKINNGLFNQPKNINKGHIPTFLLKKKQNSFVKTQICQQNNIHISEPMEKHHFHHHFNKPQTSNFSNNNNIHFQPNNCYGPTNQLRVTSPNLGVISNNEVFSYRNSVGNNQMTQKFFKFKPKNQLRAIQPEEYFCTQNKTCQQLTQKFRREQQKIWHVNTYNPRFIEYRHI